MALVILKRMLGGGGYASLEAAVRAEVEAKLLGTLSGPDSTLRPLAAACLALIAKHDFPESVALSCLVPFACAQGELKARFVEEMAGACVSGSPHSRFATGALQCLSGYPLAFSASTLPYPSCYRVGRGAERRAAGALRGDRPPPLPRHLRCPGGAS